IAGLQAKHSGVSGYVRPAFIDDSDNAKRNANAFDTHAIGARPRFHNRANRVLEGPHNVDTGRNCLDARRIQREPIEKCSRGAGGTWLGNVLGIGGQNRGSLCPDRRSHEEKSTILLLGSGECEHAGGRTRTPANLAHHRDNVAGSLNALKRSRHICQKAHKTLIRSTFLSRWAYGGEVSPSTRRGDRHWG